MTNPTEVRTYITPAGEETAQSGRPAGEHGDTAASQHGPGAAMRKTAERGKALLHDLISDRAALLRLVRGLAAALLAFLLGSAWIGNGAFGGNPLGLALLCAGGGLFPALLLGTAAAALRRGAETGICLSAVLLAAGMRYLAGRLLLSPEDEETDETEDGDAETDLSDGADAWSAGRLRRAAVPPGEVLLHLFPPGVFTRASVSVRVGCAFAAACPIAAGILFSGHFTTEAVLGAAVCFLSLPLFTYLFCGLAPETLPAPAHKEAGVGALCWALTAAAGDAMLFGLSVKLIAAYLITLYIAKNGGFLRGGLCGLLCGMACDALYAPAFALAGAAAGVFFGVHAAPAVLISVLAASGYAVYVGAFPALRLLVPELIAGGAVAYPAARYIKLPDVFYGKQSFSAAPPAVLGKNDAVGADIHGTGEAQRVPAERLGLPGIGEQLDSLSGILSGLSAAFWHLSDHGKKPGLYEIRQLCETTADRFCSACPLHEECWEKDFSRTADAMGRITLCVQRKGRAEVSAAFAPLDKRCPSFARMLAEINEASCALCEEKITRDRIGVAAADYEGMAAILRAVAAENVRACTEDAALSRRMGRAMARMGFRARHVAVYGERRRVVVASGIDMGLHAVGETGAGVVAGRALLGAEELRESFSALAGVRYQLPDYALNPSADGGRTLDMTMRAVPRFEVSCGYFGEKKAGEEVTGDALSCFGNRGDYFHVLLCDGMGSGREASVTSQLCTLFLEKLLSVCSAHGAALNLLNGFLRSRQGECAASVDLCGIDTLTGDAVFLKCGAAATYLIRGDSIFRIASDTMPLGILKEVNAEETAFPLCDGDILLFCSDGVCREDEDAQWILRTARIALRMGRRSPDIASADEPSSSSSAAASSPDGAREKRRKSPLDRAAEHFVRAAADRHSDREDDRTAAFVRIREVKETDIA